MDSPLLNNIYISTLCYPPNLFAHISEQEHPIPQLDIPSHKPAIETTFSP